MSKRRSQIDLAQEAQAKVDKEKARLELDRLRFKRDAVKHRRKMLSVHKAAEKNRFTQDWTAPYTSADSAIVPDLKLLNARARQVVRDDAWGKAIVRAFRRNVVGTGITPSIDDKPYASAWRRWAETPRLIDMEKRRTFVGIQDWAISELAAVGEAFVVRWITGRGRNRRLTLQCFEFEQLDEYKYLEHDTGNEVRHGIEVDENGAPVAYHFYKHHPHDIRGLARPAPIMLESMRVPASMVCHIYDPERVRQTHGISRMRPVLRKIRDLSEYDAAQLRVARAEAGIGLLVKGDENDEELSLDGLNVAYLNHDEEVTQFTPSRPGGEYDPFVRAQIKAIAAGVGLSYEQVARDFSGGNFSSQRQGSIEDRREFEALQSHIVTQLCDPVHDDWTMVWAMQNPEASGGFFLRGEPERVDWQGQGWDWVDPEAQGKAIERKYRLGLTSRTIEANRLGLTVEQLDEQRRQDGTTEILRDMDGDGRENPAPQGAESVEPEGVDSA